MFFARHPSTDAIDCFLRDSQKLPLSYGPIGIVREEAASRELDEDIVVIGHGKSDFERARSALRPEGSPMPDEPSLAKALIMPVTVPSRPIIGAQTPMTDR